MRRFKILFFFLTRHGSMLERSWHFCLIVFNAQANQARLLLRVHRCQSVSVRHDSASHGNVTRAGCVVYNSTWCGGADGKPFVRRVTASLTVVDVDMRDVVEVAWGPRRSVGRSVGRWPCQLIYLLYYNSDTVALAHRRSVTADQKQSLMTSLAASSSPPSSSHGHNCTLRARYCSSLREPCEPMDGGIGLIVGKKWKSYRRSLYAMHLYRTCDHYLCSLIWQICGRLITFACACNVVSQ